MQHTSKEWWIETRADNSKLTHWLQRQYIGEIAAVNLLSEVLMRFGSSASPVEWENIHKVMMQEALHAKWVKELLDARGITPEPNGDARARYWSEILPNVTNFAEAMAAAYHAEHMRLERIREIAETSRREFPHLRDVIEAFRKIWPHEKWHAEIFDVMRSGREMTRYHAKGLEALNLAMA